MSKKLDSSLWSTFAVLVIIFGVSIGCQKKVQYTNHLRNITLKLAHPIKIKIELIEAHKDYLNLKPVFETEAELSQIHLKWIVDIESHDKYTLFEQDFLKEDFSEEKLREVHVPIKDPRFNHKIVLMVNGLVDGVEFNNVAIYNSKFQKEIDDAKDKLLDRSSVTTTPGKL